MLTTEGTLRIQDHAHDSAHTWVLTGRLSRATAPAFEAALAKAEPSRLGPTA